MTAGNFEKSGALNLLQNCMNVHSQSKVLLVCEDFQYGWYDLAAATLLSDVAREMEAEVAKVLVGSPDDELPSDYSTLIDKHDTIIYLARIGDQERFTNNLPGKNVAMLYTRDAASLSGAYASFNHNAMKDLKTAVDNISFNANQITITCPLGTELNCRVSFSDYQTEDDVAIERFPLCVPQPILAKNTTGKVALSNWLTPTGSRSYSPASCQIDGVVFAEVEKGRIAGFDGEQKCVEAIEAHYTFVADKFGIDKNVVHSWHAGMHPACSYSGRAEDDPDRWSNNIFGSPRFLHFHTCGDYPPGEICWMVLDPTIAIDGVPLWHDGHLLLENFDETSAVTNNWPELKNLASASDVPIGLNF